ncbi:MAG: hydrogenase maturation nickel metallochaperone HypA [Candidatus Brocadiaceae bacterium]
MHELALSQSIVRTALSASGVDARRVTAIGLQVGELAAVNVSSLEFCMELVLQEHEMSRAEVRIERVPAKARCQCGHVYAPTDMFSPCPNCAGFEREITRGKDVDIEYVEVEDEEG